MAKGQTIPPGSALAYDLATHSLREQLARIDALDTKAGVLLAADGVLAGLLFTQDSLIVQAPRGLALMAAAGLILSLLLALLAFANRRYESAPAAAALVRFMHAEESWLKWRFLGNMLDALEVNRRKLTWKARLLTSALFALIVAAGNLGGYFMYALVSDRIGGT